LQGGEGGRSERESMGALQGNRPITDLGFEITMNNSMTLHQRQRQQDLARETTNERCRKTNKAICFDELVKVDAQELHGDAEVTSEIKMLRHLDDMMFFVCILGKGLNRHHIILLDVHTHLRRLSRILISTRA
jgi:hypothetical protein